MNLQKEKNRLIWSPCLMEASPPYQGDQNFEKMPFISKSSQSSLKAQKNHKTSTSKPSLKFTASTLNHFWNLKIPTTNHFFIHLLSWKCNKIALEKVV
jgi:hypothetical protein